MNTIIPEKNEDPLELLERCHGYYQRPPGGPLVGYAGRDEKGRQYVGEAYANFAKGERHGPVLKRVAKELLRIYPFLAMDGTGFCAAPEGGKALAVMLAVRTGKSYIFPEKEVIELKTPTSRERSRLFWGRHEPEQGEQWWIVEDVCNNFSTTLEMINLIQGRDARVLGICCFLNRSLKYDAIYRPPPSVSELETMSDGPEYPIYSVVTKPIAEYRQDDPAVTADIAAGNVELKPKNHWAKLEEAMKVARSRDFL